MRAPTILLCLVAGACTTDASLHQAHQGVPGPDIQMNSEPNGFAIRFRSVRAADLSDRNQERLRRHFIHDMVWQLGRCTPQKRYRIVGRRVTSASAQADGAPMVATIEYTGQCIRDRGCERPPWEWIAEALTGQAIRERAAGRPYYEGCRWLEERLRRSNHPSGGTAAVPREEGGR